MDIGYLLSALDIESATADLAVRRTPALARFFSHDFAGQSVPELRAAYLRFLKMTADYVVHSVPMLRAAGEALQHGDEEDRAWSKLFLDYAQDEIDEKGDYGHHIWAINDMRALGAPAADISAPPHPSVAIYVKYLVDDAKLHPYGILGTKGVLEHVSIRMCDDLVKGVIESGIENASDAVTFFHHHGILDIDHVKGGDRNLERIVDPRKQRQILEGAYFTGGCYRAMLHAYV